MRLKTTSLFIFLMIASFAVNAQISNAEAEAMINLLSVQKREAIAKLVPVSGKDSVAFWKIYTEYEKEDKRLGLSRLALYQRTAKAYYNMTNALADSLSIKYLENRIVQERDLEEYYKKIKAATNAVTAFEFYQAEVYMLTQLRANIMHQIPTYGELKAAQNALIKK